MIRPHHSVAVTLALVAAISLGCGGSDSEGGAYGFSTGALMLPGENCLRCHSKGSPYPRAPTWTAGGTVFARADATESEGVSGAVIEITDKAGRKVILTTNSAGNFYTQEELQAPFRVAIEHNGRRAEMPIEAPAGSCNACHSHPDPTGGTKGFIRIPNGDGSSP